ncbi:NACHT domain-containing protein [Streptomyces sp. NPDC054874]
MRQLAEAQGTEKQRTDVRDLNDSDAPVPSEMRGDLPGSVSDGVPAEAVFAGTDRVRVVLATAGGGKSVLLRQHLSDAAASRLAGGAHGQLHPAVPVLIRATALATEPLLPRALATAVVEELGPYGLRDVPTADFFTRPPYPGLPWLVMVDGLDEVPGSATRVALLERLARESGQEPLTYRFVVATRPLPEGELARLGPDVALFGLRPFTSADLGMYAQRCFRDLPNRDRHVQVFTAGLRTSGLDELARTPLMASMLCPLYAANPTRPLPDGRTGAYQSFVELLYEQNTHKRVRATHAEAIRVVTDRHQIPRDQQAAERAAGVVRDELPHLINHVAHERMNGNTAPVVAILASHLCVRRPDKVRPSIWDAFLGDLLRPTGLLAERAGDFHFLHHTLLEYHAARHATRDVQARSELLTRLFPRQPLCTEDDAAASDAPVAPARPLALDPSYLGFLLNGLLAPGDRVAADTVRALDELAARDAVAAVRLLADQVRLRTGLPTDLLARHLPAFSRDKKLAGYRIVAAAYLTRIEGHRDNGAELLVDLADDTDLTFENRVRAATQLARIKAYRPRAAKILMRMAGSSSLGDILKAGEALGRMAEYRSEAIAIFTSILSRDPLPNHRDLHERMDIAAVLVFWGNERGIKLLVDLADDTDLTFENRVRAATQLARIKAYRPRAAKILMRMAGSSSLGDILKAGEALGRMAEYRSEAIAIFTSILSRDPLPNNLDFYERMDIAAVLAFWGNERGIELLLHMTHNNALSIRHRARAAYGLARLDDERVAAPLSAMTVYDDPEDDIYGPVLAANALARLSRHREDGARALARIARDSDAWDSLARVEAAEFLSNVDGYHEAARALLTRLSADHGGATGRHAAKALAKLRKRRPPV